MRVLISWVPDPDTGSLWKVDQQRAAPESISADLEAPWGITRLDDDRFLISDTRSNSIMIVPMDGEPRVAQSALRAPTGIARDADIIYFANGGSARRGIEFFETADDGSFSEVKPLVSGLQNTTNIVLGVRTAISTFPTRWAHGELWAGLTHPIAWRAAAANQDVEMVVFSDIPAPARHYAVRRSAACSCTAAIARRSTGCSCPL